MERLEVSDGDLARIDAIGEAQPTLELLDDLPENQRQAVVARVVEELKYGELAERMQCSEAVVRQRVSRGLSLLRLRIGARR